MRRASLSIALFDDTKAWTEGLANHPTRYAPGPGTTQSFVIMSALIAVSGESLLV
jgi:hypothetical protein